MSKDKKVFEKPKYDTQLLPTEVNPGHMLSLPEPLKKFLTDAGLDWRFMNSQEFRNNGNYHHSQFVPFQVTAEMSNLGITGTSIDGHIMRKDLILGVRTKALSAKYKELKRQRTEALSNFGRTEAKKMREHVQKSGLGDHVTVEEGYEEDDKGYSSN